MQKPNKDIVIYLLAISAVILLFLLLNRPEKETPKGILITNDKIIEGFNTNNLNISNATDVFRYVFSGLEDEVTIYPTENYYYFKFPYAGKMVWGSLSLSATTRDNGTIGLGYSEHSEDTTNLDTKARMGGGAEFTAKDGVIVEKISDFKYSVEFEGKTVIFNLYDIGMNPPKKAKLREEEVFVGPVVDEAGIKLFLIYNEKEYNLYLVLNEDHYVPETFLHLNDDIIIGERTGFAFYLDDKNNRKILVGVKGEHTLKNDWYDGPHDQMPDNYVYTGQIPDYQKYIENAYGLQGRIDKYGNYLDEEGVRVAVAPYMVYFSEDDFYALVLCEQYAGKPQFYKCITMQRFEVPKEFEEQTYLFKLPYEPEKNSTLSIDIS